MKDKLDIVEYLKGGKSQFGLWFYRLNPQAAAKVTTALYRLEHGNLSNVKSAGKGVQEYRIDHGPGYRIYFGREGCRLIILLGGGSKKRQDTDIKRAHAAWQDYKKERRER